jgi:hypothetical protein
MAGAWQRYISGQMTAGPFVVICDGRNSGDHDEYTVITWWRDDRTEWQCYAGRPWGDRRRAAFEEKSGHFGSHVLGEDRLQWWARARCDGCGLDHLRRFDRWVTVLDKFAAAGVARVSLRDLTRWDK